MKIAHMVLLGTINFLKNVGGEKNIGCSISNKKNFVFTGKPRNTGFTASYSLPYIVYQIMFKEKYLSRMHN